MCGDHASVLGGGCWKSDLSEWNVDPKNATPTEVLRENAADYWTERAGERKIGSEPSLKSPSLFWRNDFADDGLRQGHEAPASESLQCARTDESHEIWGHRARCRTSHKDSERPDEHSFAPECVSHTTVQRSSYGCGEKIRSHYPGQVGKSAE